MSAPPLEIEPDARSAVYRIYSPAAAQPYRPWQLASAELVATNDEASVAPTLEPASIVTRPDEPERPFLPTSCEPAPTLPPAQVAATPIDRELVAVLARPRLPDETIDLAYRRKELDLIALLAMLSRSQCRALSERLQAPRSDDELATHFGRLTPERRGRVLAFLEDARRHQLRGAPCHEAIP